jgi:hypothetical protein
MATKKPKETVTVSTKTTTTPTRGNPKVSTTTSRVTVTSPKPARRPPRPAPKPAEKKSNAGAALLLLLAIIIILLLAYWLWSNRASQTVLVLPAFQSTGAAVPPAFANMLTQPSQQTTLSLAQLSESQLSMLQQFSVSYAGSLYLQPGGTFASIAKVNSPLFMNESRFSQEIKLKIDATGLPVLGTGDIQYLNLTSGTFTCTNFNASAAATYNYANLLLGSRNTTCSYSNGLLGVNLNQVAHFNLTALEGTGLQLSYTTLYQSTYQGVPCTYIAGTMSKASSSGANIGNGAFGECISDTYDTPVSFAMYYVGQNATVSTVLNETQIGNYSSQSYVESMPGPVT